MKKLLKKSLWVMSGLACLYIAWMTGTGDILNYINFADPLNEMGFFAATASMGGMMVFVGFSE